MSYIDSTTAERIQRGETKDLVSLDHHGHPHTPIVGEPAAVWRFTERGVIKFGVITRGHPWPEKYAAKENAELIWEAAS